MLSLLFPQCAIQVAPTGGPKDTIPPVLLRSVPPMYATNVTHDRITLTFDEYIKLEKISEKLVLSPPQEQLPSFRIRGKSIEITFEEALDDSTTYTLYFADAIVDNNEGNKLENFEFAFSTGPIIDSLRFAGKVLDAYTLKPREGVFVMLYTRFEDSIPMKERPRYVTKTNAEGQFFLSNLKFGNYKIFALADGNSNYKFDQVSEEIAFLDYPIDTSMLKRPSQMTINSDSLATLYLFEEQNQVLSLTDYGRPQRRRLKMGFSRPIVGDIEVRPLNVEVDTIEPWFVKGRSAARDSIDFWITNNELSIVDTLVVIASYQKTDSLMNLVQTHDTLRMFYQDRPQTTRRPRRGEEETKEEQKPVGKKLSVNASVGRGASLTPVEKIRFSFGMPLLTVDTTQISLFNQSDSITIPLLNFKPDSLDPRCYYINHQWENNKTYELTILPNAFTNLDGATNDTLKYNFKGANPEQFGVVKLALTGVTPNVLVELLSDKESVVTQKVVDEDGEIAFSYIKPGKYFIRFILDSNRNGQWDTGWYLKNQQPETVFIYQDQNENKEIQVRANWEYELNFNLKSNNHVSSDELRDVPNQEEHEHQPLRIPDSEERSL